jgi:hypothetical protein
VKKYVPGVFDEFKFFSSPEYEKVVFGMQSIYLPEVGSSRTD